jgi:hypothetical protein
MGKRERNTLCLLILLTGALDTRNLLNCQVVSSEGKSAFADDFEIGDTSNWWSVNQTGPGTIITVTRERAHSGLYSMKASLEKAQGVRIALASSRFSGLNPVNLRTFVFVDSGFSLANGSRVELLNFSDSSTWKNSAVYLSNVRGTLFLSADNAPSGTTPFTLGQWHALEFSYQSGAGNGVVALDLDGRQELKAEGVTLGTVDVARLGLYTGSRDVSGSVYFDDVAISDSHVGAPSAGLTVRHANTFARTAFTLDSTMWGQLASDTLAVTIGAEVVYRKNGIAGREFPVIQLSKLKAGDYQMQVALVDSGGAAKAQVSETIRKYVDGTPRVGIDENNSLLLEGKKFFPVTPFILHSNEVVAWRKAGYINSNGWGSAGTGASGLYTKEQHKVYIDDAGLSIGPNNYFASDGKGITVNNVNAVRGAAAYVEFLKDDPNVFMWTWVDEPDLGGTPTRVLPSRVQEFTETVRTADVNHPTIVNLSGYKPGITKGNGFLFPHLVSDVYAFDMYPTIYHSTLGITIADYVRNIDLWQRYNYGLTPWLSFVEVRPNPNKDGSCCTPGPTPQQLRMEAWLNVVHGIKGIGWWHPWITIPPENLAEMARFVDQIGRLTDVILGPNSIHELTSNATQAGLRVDTMVREDARNVWIFAVRLTDFGEEAYSALTAQFQLSDIADATAQIFDENRTATITNGTFSDSFAPCAVHIYRIPKPQGPTGIEAVVH